MNNHSIHKLIICTIIYINPTIYILIDIGCQYDIHILFNTQISNSTEKSRFDIGILCCHKSIPARCTNTQTAENPLVLSSTNLSKLISFGARKDIHVLLRAEGKAQAEQRLFWRWKLRRPHLTQRVWVLFLLLPKLPVPLPCKCHRGQSTALLITCALADCHWRESEIYHLCVVGEET